MKIILIQPAQLEESGKLTKFKKLLMPAITLPTIAGLTPKDIEVKIIDDYVEDINFDEDVDLVGITAMTCQAPRAYQIADEFRKRGKKTIMGGLHASFCTEEALQHFDSVLVGEAEDLWEKVIEDVKTNNLKRVYKSLQYSDLSRLVIPRFDLLNYNNYVIPPLSKTPCIPIQTTRGCPFQCDFCSVTAFLGNKIRKKPIEHVLKEIKTYFPSLIFFTDDNIGAEPDYARSLFAALTPLKIKWACFMSTTILKHPELIELAAKANCHETFVGIESISEDSLKLAHKGFNKVKEYKELFKRLKEAGILAQASFVFGLDGDTADSLRRTIDTVLDWDVKFLYIFILAPLPGTKIYQRLKSEGRIVSENWSLYDGRYSVLKFKGIDSKTLEEIMWMSYEKFYSIKNILQMAWRFKKQYILFFPRDNIFEDVFFQFRSRCAVKKRLSPLTHGLTKDKQE